MVGAFLEGGEDGVVADLALEGKVGMDRLVRWGWYPRRSWGWITPSVSVASAGTSSSSVVSGRRSPSVPAATAGCVSRIATPTSHAVHTKVRWRIAEITSNVFMFVGPPSTQRWLVEVLRGIRRGKCLSGRRTAVASATTGGHLDGRRAVSAVAGISAVLCVVSASTGRSATGVATLLLRVMAITSVVSAATSVPPSLRGVGRSKRRWGEAALPCPLRHVVRVVVSVPVVVRMVAGRGAHRRRQGGHSSRSRRTMGVWRHVPLRISRMMVLMRMLPVAAIVPPLHSLRLDLLVRRR